MFEFSLHTCSKCSPSSSLMFSFLVSMPTLQCWWQPAWGEVDPCWHMPMASMWFFPYCNDSIPHEAICPEYQEFGSLIVFHTRLKTRGSSDSWQCQKCSVKIHLAFSSFAEDLNSCFLTSFLCHLSQSTIYLWFGSQIKIIQLWRRGGIWHVTLCLGTLLAHSHFIQAGYFRLKSTESPHDWCRSEVNSKSSKWFLPASAHHLSTTIM